MPLLLRLGPADLRALLRVADRLVQDGGRAGGSIICDVYLAYVCESSRCAAGCAFGRVIPPPRSPPFLVTLTHTHGHNNHVFKQIDMCTLHILQIEQHPCPSCIGAGTVTCINCKGTYVCAPRLASLLLFPFLSHPHPHKYKHPPIYISTHTYI